MPDVSVMKSPRSVSFAKMNETDFKALYKTTNNMLGTFIISKTLTISKPSRTPSHS
ncbi:DUF1367 family protein [Acerihabitans arboris]|uniref:DUF1367 family protein n=1 Tax=Acerihabitans arboris TaxID=2691583 RepID=A0A845SNY0_9GAMM|nr:DUF1367 family protein [Acerihabitans arboris]